MFRKSAYFLYDFLGLKYVWEKVQPPADTSGKRQPRTFFLWFVGIYISLFGLAANRYEKAVSRLEDHVRFVISGAGSTAWKGIAYEIPKVQHTRVPYPPKLGDPFSVLHSFFSKYNQKDEQSIDAMQILIHNKKADLSKANLSQLILANGADLRNMNISGKSFHVFSIKERSFSRSNFSDAILDGARFENVDFYGSNFSGAVLSDADMRNTNLAGANLQRAILQRTNLKGASLLHADLKLAILEESNFENAVIAGADLSEAQEIQSARWQGSLYNSVGFTLKSLLKDEEVKSFCEKHQLNDSCFQFIRGHTVTLFEKATKFPPKLRPEELGMIDVYELIKIKRESSR